MANRYFCRFTNVAIVKGADIRNCFVRFTAYDGQVTANIQLNCYFVDEDNPDAPADKAELDALNLTSGVAWDSLPAWQDGSEYMTPDLSSILEAVVGRAGWESGNAVILVIEDNSSPSDVHRKISAYEYGSGLEKPSLNVGWYSEVEGFFDNTKWQPDQLNPATPIETSWSGTYWNFNLNADSDGGRLVVKGTWHVNYQPSEIAIKHTHGGTPELKIYAADGIIYHSLGYTSEDIITPLWAGRSKGIYAFQFMLAAGDNTPFNVTDITFNSAAPAVQTTTSTSSTASTTSSTVSTVSTTSVSSTTSSTISTTSSTSTASTTSSTSTTASTSTSTSSTASSTSTATTGSTYSTFSTTHTTISTTTSTSTTASTISTTSSTSTTASTTSTTSSTVSTVSTISITSTSSSTLSTTSTSTSTTTSTSTSTSTTASTISTISTTTSTSSSTSTTSTTASTISTISTTTSTSSSTSTSTSTSTTASTISTTTSTSITSSTSTTASTISTISTTTSTSTSSTTSTTASTISTTSSTSTTTSTSSSTSTTASTISTTTSTSTSSSTSTTASTISTSTTTSTSSTTSTTASTISTTSSTSTTSTSSTTSTTASTTSTSSSTSTTASTISTSTSTSSTASSTSTISTTSSTSTTASTISTTSTSSTTSTTASTISTTSSTSTISTTSTTASTISTISTSTTLPYEVLTSFTEVDSGDDITVTDKKCEFDTMQRVANSYVHKDYGTDYFDDFEIEFEIELTATQNNSLVCVCAVTDSPGTYADHDTSNEGLMAFIYMGGVSNMVIGILNSGSFELSSAENRSTLAKRYATFKRSGTSTTFTLYTDAERTIVDGFFTKTVTSTSTPYDYLQVVASRDSGSAESITGYTQNFEIISN